ncbi:MAG TPA: family 1 glycosylhydrolase [Candidatus Dormibacteraeota bacterium]|nr:family 1 glycosylhydrolase [Candidatus Dormibacteraeota bacterium]
MARQDSGALLFPEGFLFGCATAAHQVEGGNLNDWSRWEQQPRRIKDGSTATRAIGHYQRYREDLRELAESGQNAHRFSVEWSRVEPREGEFDRDALAHYADVVRTCRSLGMEPVVTLHHFTLPLWLADAGGARAPRAALRFARYAAACAEAFAAGVRWWITVNEPVVLATVGSLRGEWPPGETSLLRTFAAVRGLARMHAAAAYALRRVAAAHGREARVSVAHHVRGLLPANPASALDRAVAAVPDFVFNRWWLRACRSGRLLPPVGRGERVPELAGSLDYVGLNYYCDDVLTFDLRRPRELFARQGPPPGRPLNTFGWAIEPDGLRRALHLVHRESGGLPVMITENGVADEHDELRPRFLVEHLEAVHRAIAEGVDVRGYMHWTAWDNFEWAEGFSQRFGLSAVDMATLERCAKPSAAVYAQICRSRGIPAELRVQD